MLAGMFSHEKVVVKRYEKDGKLLQLHDSKMFAEAEKNGFVCTGTMDALVLKVAGNPPICIPYLPLDDLK